MTSVTIDSAGTASTIASIAAAHSGTAASIPVADSAIPAQACSAHSRRPHSNFAWDRRRRGLRRRSDSRPRGWGPQCPRAVAAEAQCHREVARLAAGWVAAVAAAAVAEGARRLGPAIFVVQAFSLRQQPDRLHHNGRASIHDHTLATSREEFYLEGSRGRR